jgi:hypothetical protein
MNCIKLMFFYRINIYIMKLKKLFQNKALLYVVLVLAIINVVGYFTVNDLNAVVFFVLVGFLTTFFNKNMIIVLLSAMIFTYIFRANSLIEGMSSSRARNTTKSATVPVPASEDDEDEIIGSSQRIDRAATLDTAYKNLQNMVGPGGMKQMTKDTENLMQQQQGLMETLKTMEPMINQTSKMLKTINLEGLGGLIDGLQSNIGRKK